MALSFVGAASYAASSGALPAFTAGDLALVFAYRDGSNTAPSLPAGWTNIAFSGANTNSARVGYRVLLGSDTTTSAWANATEIQVLVLRGQHVSPIGGFSAAGLSSNQINYAAVSLVSVSSPPQGLSWIAGFAGHRSATDVNAKAVTGMTTRSTSVTTLGAHTAQDVASFSASNYTTTVNASLGWRSYAVEVRSAVTQKLTGFAQISLTSGNIPATRTAHVINVRARITTTPNSELLGVQLYEGATPRSAALGSPVLTTSLTTYSFAVADSDAASIGSYADLWVAVWGISPGGSATVFEVAEVSLTLPVQTTGAQYGATSASFVMDAVTQGSVLGAGTKQTAVARLSLSTGFTPSSRTNHVITLRARRTALQGTIRMQLFEGTTLRSFLETGELTTSLATYTLSILDADAATIGDYSNLELRVWGYSSTGVATVFEIADVSLQLPASSSGGTLFGAVVIQSVSLVSAGAGGGPVYPGSGVFPSNFAHVLATSTITAVGKREYLAASVLPLTATLITSAVGAGGLRTGQVAINSTATVTAVGTPAYLGKVLIASVATVSAGSTQAVTGVVAIASTASVSATAYVPAVPPPATYVVHALGGMPAYLVGIAFTSDPLDPIQNFSGVTPYVREMAGRRGRQFELDRIEAGESDFILSNNDGRFSPENTGGPYYPNVTATRRIRWRAFWGAIEYDLFNGFLEGYPQEYPSQGKDSLVRQHAVDGFMALAVAKFVPGQTVLTSDLVATTEQTSEIIDVASTALPMPQSVPFVITIENESLTVTEIMDTSVISSSGSQYRVDRVQGSPAHTAGVSVLTTAVSFGEEYTGQRIRNVLARIGIPPGEMSVEDGQTLLAPSEDLSTQAPTEHLQFVAEVEGGVFFNSASNKWTFYDRHHVFKNETSARATFGDGAGELPYHEVEVTHDDKKIVNLIRVTTASGHVAEARDQASINEHFERPLEKQWPLANDNDAEAAAHYLLYRYSALLIRVPRLQLMGRANPSSMWPIVLGLEIGQRYRVIRRGAGTAIDKQLIVEGVSRTADKSNLVTDVQLSLADTRHYWRVNTAGYGELGQTTTVAY